MEFLFPILHNHLLLKKLSFTSSFVCKTVYLSQFSFNLRRQHWIGFNLWGCFEFVILPMGKVWRRPWILDSVDSKVHGLIFFLRLSFFPFNIFYCFFILSFAVSEILYNPSLLFNVLKVKRTFSLREVSKVEKWSSGGNFPPDLSSNIVSQSFWGLLTLWASWEQWKSIKDCLQMKVRLLLEYSMREVKFKQKFIDLKIVVKWKILVYSFADRACFSEPKPKAN